MSTVNVSNGNEKVSYRSLNALGLGVLMYFSCLRVNNNYL